MGPVRISVLALTSRLIIRKTASSSSVVSIQIFLKREFKSNFMQMEIVLLENITVRNWTSVFHLINPVEIALEMIAAMEMARSVERNAFTSLTVTMKNMTAMVYV